MISNMMSILTLYIAKKNLKPWKHVENPNQFDTVEFFLYIL